jgi:monoamine oxidase
VTYDTVIIGAGAAGLSAARVLSGAGKRIAILEARSRLGGRIASLLVPTLPVPIELGAEFIHGEFASTFSITDAAPLIVGELPDDHWWVVNGKKQKIDFWSQINKVRSRIRHLRTDISFDEFLRRQKGLSPRLREMACRFVEGYHAAHAERMSTKVLEMSDEEQEGEGNRQFRLAGPQSGILDFLRAGLDPDKTQIFLETPVTRVEWSPGSVTVHANGRRFRAKSLVITIPIGVWKAKTIEFDPPLHEKESAIEKLETGHVVKIVFHFRERFFDQCNFLHTEDRFMQTWWTTAPFRSPILTGWAGGRAAEALSAEGPDARLDRALDSLAKAWSMPRRKVDDLLAATFMHDWQADPWSRGAYSYSGVGGAHAHDALAKPLRKTLFFAGEATSSDQTGTVAGAIDSGRRAARELLR